MNRRRTIGRLITRGGAALVLAVLAPIATSLYSAWVFHGSAAGSSAAIEVISAIERISANASDKENAATIARIDAMVERLAAYPRAAALPIEPDEPAVRAKNAAGAVQKMWLGIRAAEDPAAGAMPSAEEILSFKNAAATAALQMAEAGRTEAEGLRRRLIFVTVFSLGVVALVTITAAVRVAMPMGRLAAPDASVGGDTPGFAPGPYAATEITIAADRLEMAARRYHDAEDQRQSILNSLPMAVFEVDGRGRVRYFNTSGERLAASAGLELNDLAFTDLLDETSHAAFQELMDNATATAHAVPLGLGTGDRQALVVVQPLSGHESPAERWAVWCDTGLPTVAHQPA